MFNSLDTRILTEKWKTYIRHEKFAPISAYKEKVIACLMENQMLDIAHNGEYQRFNQQIVVAEGEYNKHLIANGLLNEDAPPNSAGAYPENPNLKGFTLPLTDILRRQMPFMMAFDVAGVTPMKQSSGHIFALRARYGTQGGTEALHNESNTAYTGTGTHSAYDPFDVAFSYGTGLTTAAGEALGTGGSSPDMPEMALSLDRISVEAKTRALRASLTHEMIQDLMANQGIDAQKELAEIVATELMSEINREIMRTIAFIAKVGAQDADITTPGTFDLNNDSGGRYHAEKYIGLIIQLARESNAIARDTKRGVGNIVIVDCNTAAALSMAKLLDCNNTLGVDIGLDASGRTFVGTLMNRWKVYADPYIPTALNFAIVGYKGASPMDAGFHFCPYVPLQMYQASDPKSYQPSIAFKTRYGVVESPFGKIGGNSNGTFTKDTNIYYRKFRVTNLL